MLQIKFFLLILNKKCNLGVKYIFRVLEHFLHHFDLSPQRAHALNLTQTSWMRAKGHRKNCITALICIHQSPGWPIIPPPALQISIREDVQNIMFTQIFKWSHLFTLIWFQTCMTHFLLWGTRWDALWNVHAALFHIMKLNGDFKAPK